MDESIQASIVNQQRSANIDAMVASSSVANQNWYPDFRASNHITPDVSNLSYAMEYTRPERIHVANGQVYKVDIVAGEQVEKVKGIDRMNQREVVILFSPKVIPPNRGLMEHVYEPDPNASSEPNVPPREGIQTPSKDSKKRLSRATSSKRAVKETIGWKAVKTTDSTFASDASRAQKTVMVEVALKAYYADTKAEDFDSEDND
ncbi:hypothetical protein LWI28_026875 [Acer negundo]|uniref:Uncharacterized protein n=1 Tax=Acer negundo TaxID=4023 RepID=A0AAD5JGC0_ACENE|nr:hypothetical protein LWI28_026875 [Acer negundo]